MSILKEDLSFGVGTRIDSLLGQCMYFGLSFSRVGVDFRSLLIPIFQETIENSTKSQLDLVRDRFNGDMSEFTFIQTPNMVASNLLTSGHPIQVSAIKYLHSLIRTLIACLSSILFQKVKSLFWSFPT